MIDFDYNKVDNIVYVKRVGDIFLEDLESMINKFNSTVKYAKQWLGNGMIMNIHTKLTGVIL